MSVRLIDGQWLIVDGNVGTAEACCCQECSGPCEEDADCGEGCYCCDGVCQEEPCEEEEGVCAAATGDCGGEQQCDTTTDPPPAGTPCNTSLPANPLTGNTLCAGGTPTQVTLTISGVTCNSGDPTTDSEVEALINTSYVLDMTCINDATEAFTSGGWTVTAGVEFDFNAAPGGQTAGLTIGGVSSTGFSVTGAVVYDEDGPARIAHQCGLLLDCSDFSGTGTITSTFLILGGTANVSVTGM